MGAAVAMATGKHVPIVLKTISDVDEAKLLQSHQVSAQSDTTGDI